MSILVGALPSREGRAALRVAVDECLVRGTDLDVVATTAEGPGFDDDDKAAWEGRLRQAEERLTGAGHKVVTHDSGDDDMAQALVSRADSLGSDLIVIGLRRRSPVGKLLLGSNAQRVLLEAGCPVLAVKASDED